MGNQAEVAFDEGIAGIQVALGCQKQEMLLLFGA
jgi:hypothetical protein